MGKNQLDAHCSRRAQRDMCRNRKRSFAISCASRRTTGIDRVGQFIYIGIHRFFVRLVA